MLYNFNKETFKLVKENDKVKLYHKAQNKWSQGWTYIESTTIRKKQNQLQDNTQTKRIKNYDAL